MVQEPYSGKFGLVWFIYLKVPLNILIGESDPSFQRLLQMVLGAELTK